MKERKMQYYLFENPSVAGFKYCSFSLLSPRWALRTRPFVVGMLVAPRDMGVSHQPFHGKFSRFGRRPLTHSQLPPRAISAPASCFRELLFQKITQPTLTQFASPPHPRWWERQCVWETCCPSLSLLTFLQVPGALSSAGPKGLKFQRRDPHSYSSLRRGWGVEGVLERAEEFRYLFPSPPHLHSTTPPHSTTPTFTPSTLTFSPPSFHIPLSPPLQTFLAMILGSPFPVSREMIMCICRNNNFSAQA